MIRRRIFAGNFDSDFEDSIGHTVRVVGMMMKEVLQEDQKDLKNLRVEMTLRTGCNPLILSWKVAENMSQVDSSFLAIRQYCAVKL